MRKGARAQVYAEMARLLCLPVTARAVLYSMEALGHLRTVLRHPSILRSYQPLLLISHMRANTSLMGHILGASPEIEGYYELHIGYHSWRSLLRQKLVYFDQHTPATRALHV